MLTTTEAIARCTDGMCSNSVEARYDYTLLLQVKQHFQKM